MIAPDSDTIAAIATAPGKSGIGIVRLSGKDARSIGEHICKKSLPVRQAVFSNFSDNAGIIDQGLAIYFSSPASFTGEDVVELHGHGGRQVLDLLLVACLQQGARLARPGEFSERAFLNEKMDLAQAEAIADLIDAASAQAARNAVISLQGRFSTVINQLLERLIELRVYVEAAIDFPEEEIDFLADGKVYAQLQELCSELDDVLRNAQQGARMRDGLRVVIAGKPNAGKSSLLNLLAGREVAIVSSIAGTTRDVLRESIDLDGLPLHVVDTAGLHTSNDVVEQEGIRRAWAEIDNAELVLLLVDSCESQETEPDALWHEISQHKRPEKAQTLVVQNKMDISGLQQMEEGDDAAVVRISVKTGEGMELLRSKLKQLAGLHTTGEGLFSARARHVDALQRSRDVVQGAAQQFLKTGAGDLLAEDLRRAQDSLGEITGRFSSDDLLGRIFSGFCIGK